MSCRTFLEDAVYRGQGANRFQNEMFENHVRVGRYELTSRVQVINEIDVESDHLGCELFLDGREVPEEQDQLRGMEYCMRISQCQIR